MKEILEEENDLEQFIVFESTGKAFEGRPILKANFDALSACLHLLKRIEELENKLEQIMPNIQ